MSLSTYFQTTQTESMLKDLFNKSDMKLTVTSLLETSDAYIGSDHYTGEAVDVGSSDWSYLYDFFSWLVKNSSYLKEKGVARCLLSLHNHHIHISRNKSKMDGQYVYFGYEQSHLLDGKKVYTFTQENLAEKAKEYYGSDYLIDLKAAKRHNFIFSSSGALLIIIIGIILSKLFKRGK